MHKHWWTRDVGGAPVWVIALVLVAVSALIVGAATVKAERSSADPTRRPIAVFVGDSYVAGAGATSKNANWVSLVAKEMGWKAENLGRGGTGFTTAVEGKRAPSACGADRCPSFAEMAEEGALLVPEIVVVSGGRNNAGLSEQLARRDIDDLLDAVSADFPNAQIYVTNVLWDASDAPASIDRMSRALALGSERIDATFLDIGQPLFDSPDLIDDDDVHPNDSGYAAIADEVLDELR